MNNSMASRGFRAALFAFSGTLLLALAACNNGYGPPVAGEPVSWGQQHYLDVQKAQADHDARQSDNHGQGAGPRGHL